MTTQHDRSTLLRTVAALALLTAAVALSACNAVKGAGKDLQEASENVQGAIEGDD